MRASIIDIKINVMTSLPRSILLAQNGSQEGYQQLRKSVVQKIQSSQLHFEPEINRMYNCSTNDYCSRMASDFELGDIIFIQAAAVVLGIKIEVFTFNSNESGATSLHVIDGFPTSPASQYVHNLDVVGTDMLLQQAWVECEDKQSYRMRLTSVKLGFHADSIWWVAQGCLIMRVFEEDILRYVVEVDSVMIGLVVAEDLGCICNIFDDTNGSPPEEQTVGFVSSFKLVLKYKLLFWYFQGDATAKDLQSTVKGIESTVSAQEESHEVTQNTLSRQNATLTGNGLTAISTMCNGNRSEITQMRDALRGRSSGEW
ncbi:hypothetical protein BDR26DRAFT_1004835 [Obelidium mucronatum]|nr:hypothetical protein BDR26DRAFT_1004835 [Obelidium mucronatum]